MAPSPGVTPRPSWTGCPRARAHGDAKRPPDRLERRLGDVVLVATGRLHVQPEAARLREALEHVRGEPRLALEPALAPRPTPEVDRGARKRIVHRHDGVAVARDAAPVPERPVERLPSASAASSAVWCTPVSRSPAASSTRSSPRGRRAARGSGRRGPHQLRHARDSAPSSASRTEIRVSAVARTCRAWRPPGPRPGRPVERPAQGRRARGRRPPDCARRCECRRERCGRRGRREADARRAHRRRRPARRGSSRGRAAARAPARVALARGARAPRLQRRSGGDGQRGEREGGRERRDRCAEPASRSARQPSRSRRSRSRP